jgi:hypothetical protein
MADDIRTTLRTDPRYSGWWNEFVQQYGEEPDTSPGGDYDYAAAIRSGVVPTRYEQDGNRFHWPSSTSDGAMLKSADHPTAWMEHYMREHGTDPNVDLPHESAHRMQLPMVDQPTETPTSVLADARAYLSARGAPRTADNLNRAMLAMRNSSGDDSAPYSVDLTGNGPTARPQASAPVRSSTTRGGGTADTRTTPASGSGPTPAAAIERPTPQSRQQAVARPGVNTNRPVQDQPEQPRPMMDQPQQPSWIADRLARLEQATRPPDGSAPVSRNGGLLDKLLASGAVNNPGDMPSLGDPMGGVDTGPRTEPQAPGILSRIEEQTRPPSRNPVVPPSQGEDPNTPTPATPAGPTNTTPDVDGRTEDDFRHSGAARPVYPIEKVVGALAARSALPMVVGPLRDRLLPSFSTRPLREPPVPPPSGAPASGPRPVTRELMQPSHPSIMPFAGRPVAPGLSPATATEGPAASQGELLRILQGMGSKNAPPPMPTVATARPVQVQMGPPPVRPATSVPSTPPAPPANALPPGIGVPGPRLAPAQAGPPSSAARPTEMPMPTGSNNPYRLESNVGNPTVTPATSVAPGGALVRPGMPQQNGPPAPAGTGGPSYGPPCTSGQGMSPGAYAQQAARAESAPRMLARRSAGAVPTPQLYSPPPPSPAITGSLALHRHPK